MSLWSRIEQWLVGVLGLLALLLSLYAMLTRYLLPELSSDWTEEVIIYLVLWAIWLSGGRLVAERSHITTDVIVGIVSPRVRRLMAIPHHLLGLAFCAAYTWAGAEVVLFALQVGERGETSLQFPLWVYYLGMPVGILLMGVRYVRLLYDDVFKPAEDSQ